MSLVGEERKSIILDLLYAEGQVKTIDLVKRLNVSSETIRRYMEELEAENRLKRVYGGAVKINIAGEEPSYLKREVLYADEKRRIGQAAAQLVDDNDVIFLDDGTTPMQMIHFLPNKKNLTILTVSIPTLHLLMEYKNKGLYSGEVYFIGGKVNSVHARVSGSIAEKMASMFHADKAFVSIDGMVLGKGITSFDAERGQLVHLLMQNARQSVVMTDSSKIGSTQLYRIADWRDIDIVVCDKEMPKEWRETLDEREVSWIVAQA
ncbi:DeoR/GlpR family DNA-binding transcription regulator [Paenibacillus sp. LHD-117]|uniref:DeoR/GlpR family DNA-binding transcription regulator n=1 Tax=Paenibacillus sp. LHD-117 TaxID=3071412 RepID=UPI0027E0B78E|nr:DeoR/GlpR family DNA-binding transcription regulator [Paenibacillus sp. LHD-117]MDQ6419451.1 DeoR/GlpR family DNA-binding transcription regulator [Paenibacillus sp. LHD-117]